MTKESEMHNKVLEKQESINKKISGVISGMMSKIPGGKFLNNVFKLDEVATGAKTSKEAFSDLKMEKKVVSLAAGIFFYVWYKKDSGEFVWEYIDEGYGINENIYNMLKKTYNLSHDKLEEFLTSWLKTNMPFEFNEIYEVEMD